MPLAWAKVTPDIIQVGGVYPLLITANGHGRRRMCSVDENGFTYGNPKQAGRKKGFQDGRYRQGHCHEGKYLGVYTGRVAARATGSFNITTKSRTIQGIGHQYLPRLLSLRWLQLSEGSNSCALPTRSRDHLCFLSRSCLGTGWPLCPSPQRKEGLFPPLAKARGI